MDTKLQNSELKVMDVLWEKGPLPARQIAEILEKKMGWNINTTYTLIKRAISKKAIQRDEPGFLCTAIIPKELVQQQETCELAEKLFNGSIDMLFTALLSQKGLSAKKIEALKLLIDSEEKNETE